MIRVDCHGAVLSCRTEIGPSIYTLTDRLIKPITLAAGGMSWALMRHPEGLDCDIFVTHAWQAVKVF